MSATHALGDLLRRPATLAWVPLTGLAALTTVTLISAFLFAFFEPLRDFPFAAVWWTYSMLIGLLVGQSIKELQHCQFAWMLPRIRPRLRVGAMAAGILLAVFPREIVAFLVGSAALVLAPFLGGSPDLLRLWNGLPPPSLGLFALTFMAFWIGVRPSALNMLGLMLPLTLLSPGLSRFLAEYGFLALVLSAPLTAFLIYDTFSVGEARARPFKPTTQLSGNRWSRGELRGTSARTAARWRGSGRTWKLDHLGDDIGRWVRAGWYENHGRLGTFAWAGIIAVPTVAYAIQAWMVGTTMLASPSMWLRSGYAASSFFSGGVSATVNSIIVASMVAGVPLVVFALMYGTIGLHQEHHYPLSRRRRADVEYWGSLAENVTVCGLLAAVLLGFWMVIDLLDTGRVAGWPLAVGGQHGWILIIMRVLAVIFALTPLVQYFRLRWSRPRRGLSRVVRLLAALWIAAALGWIGTWVAWTTLSAPNRSPMLVHVLILAALALVSQYAYGRELERYFRTADLT